MTNACPPSHPCFLLHSSSPLTPHATPAIICCQTHLSSSGAPSGCDLCVRLGHSCLAACGRGIEFISCEPGWRLKRRKIRSGLLPVLQGGLLALQSMCCMPLPGRSGACLTEFECASRVHSHAAICVWRRRLPFQFDRHELRGVCRQHVPRAATRVGLARCVMPCCSCCLRSLVRNPIVHKAQSARYPIDFIVF